MSFKIIGIGEVLWDLFPASRQLGGAPANFAYHAHALGVRAQIITRVGNDHLGREILQRLEGMGLAGPNVQIDECAPTGTVTVALSGNGIPEFTIHEGVAWDQINATQSALSAVREADAVCFGSLAQRNEISRQAIQRLVAAATAGAWRIFDINLRQNFYNRDSIEHSLKLANVLKLNGSELPIVARMFGIEGSDRQVIEALTKRFSLNLVALTRGADGSLLYQGGRWSEQAAVKVLIKDTVGAGDSFTAALCLGLLGGMDLDDINVAASTIAAHVCGCDGATPQLPDEFRRLFAYARCATITPVTADVSASL
jgi:fructokinase